MNVTCPATHPKLLTCIDNPGAFPSLYGVRTTPDYVNNKCNLKMVFPHCFSTYNDAAKHRIGAVCYN